MKRKIISALLAAMVLLLSGCGSFLHREYSVVEPHSSDYYENEDVLRAESYQDVVNDLLILVGEQKKEGTIWLYLKDTTTDVAELAERACREVQRETPLGAYAVAYLTYTIDTTPRQYDAISVFFATWCFAIPLALLGTFVFKWPVMVVYIVMCADEIVKLPWLYPHYKKYIWLQNLTRESE